jgi:hypothetical protein
MESGNATTVKDLGFTILADPEYAQVEYEIQSQDGVITANQCCSIVLLHGLQGHPQKTWAYFPPEKKTLFRRVRIFQRMNKARSNATGFFWPCDILPGDFPRARIMTYGYDSHVTHWFKGPAMQLDIDQYGKSLLNAIEARRRDDSNRPLIFIVHSLGGLIVKDASLQKGSTLILRLLADRPFASQRIPTKSVSRMSIIPSSLLYSWELRIEEGHIWSLVSQQARLQHWLDLI